MVEKKVESSFFNKMIPPPPQKDLNKNEARFQAFLKHLSFQFPRTTRFPKCTTIIYL